MTAEGGRALSRTRTYSGEVIAGAILFAVLILTQQSLRLHGSVSAGSPATPSVVAGELYLYSLVNAALLVLYLAVVLGARTPTGRRGLVMLLGLPIGVMAVLVVASPPTFSFDALSYVAQGAASQMPQGGDAYSTLPSAMVQSPVGQELVGLGWVPAPAASPYGPIWTLVEILVVRLPVNAAAAVTVFKLIAALATLGSAAVIWKIVGVVRPQDQLSATLLFLWNPVVLMETAGEGHNDALMILPALLALYATVRAWSSRAVVFTTVGALVRYLPALFALPELVYLVRTRAAGWGWAWGVFVGVAIAVPVVIAAYLPFWNSQVFDSLARSSQGGPWPLWASVAGVTDLVIQSVAPTVDASSTRRLLFSILFVAFVLVVSLRTRDATSLLVASANIALVYALIVSPVYWPWYAVFPISILALTPLGRALPLIVVLSIGARAIAPLVDLRADVVPFDQAYQLVTLGATVAGALVFLALAGGLGRARTRAMPLEAPTTEFDGAGQA